MGCESLWIKRLALSKNVYVCVCVGECVSVYCALQSVGVYYNLCLGVCVCAVYYYLYIMYVCVWTVYYYLYIFCVCCVL